MASKFQDEGPVKVPVVVLKVTPVGRSPLNENVTGPEPPETLGDLVSETAPKEKAVEAYETERTEELGAVVLGEVVDGPPEGA